MQPLADLKNLRVLVADDDPAIVELVTARLDLAGYRSCHARNGFECMTRLSELRPAALILDINMPGRDGFEVLRLMGATGVAKTPTMVLTARNQPDDVRRAIGLGARDYLAKPFNDAQLLMRVARLLRKAPVPVAAAPPHEAVEI